MNVAGLAGIDVRGVAYDSRQVKPGDVFVALK
jgi:UDP-N-acetylmuramyl pentapeptide synthase